MEAVRKVHFEEAEAIAQHFVTARLAGAFLPDFPGTLPPDLASAYAVQDAAIDLWPDEVAGWKIGRIPPDHEIKLGAKSLAGPIFRKDVRLSAPGSLVEFGMFVGGFSAVEGEFLFEIGQDAPAGKMSWTTSDAVAIVKRMLVGVETAGSPLATINKIGPKAVVSDFGNNAGLIVGPEVPNWVERSPSELACETFIYGKSVGHGTAANVMGGPLEALRFVAELCGKRRRPLKAGMLISTGATTGIHEVTAGEIARVEFKGIGAIQCAAKPRVSSSR
jgi:2-keto-4-pentenoate hydratase